MLRTLCVLWALILCSSTTYGQEATKTPSSSEDAAAPAAEPEEVEPEEVEPEEVDYNALSDDEIEAVEPDDFSEQEVNLILLDSVVHENAWWSAVDVGVSAYDPRRDVLIARWTPGLAVGRRFSTYGFFGTVQFDQSLDFTLDLAELSVVNVGIGAEYLSFLGHVRSSLMVGSSILITRTPIDEPGEVGWFIELRPGSLRWAISDAFTLEFSPIALDVIAPVTEGIPLVIYAYTSVLAVEWDMTR